MGYQSKTWSLSDEVVAVIEAAKANGETPNQFLRRVLLTERGGVRTEAPLTHSITDTPPPARELLVELDGEGENEKV